MGRWGGGGGRVAVERVFGNEQEVAHGGQLRDAGQAMAGDLGEDRLGAFPKLPVAAEQMLGPLALPGMDWTNGWQT